MKQIELLGKNELRINDIEKRVIIGEENNLVCTDKEKISDMIKLGFDIYLGGKKIVNKKEAGIPENKLIYVKEGSKFIGVIDDSLPNQLVNSFVIKTGVNQWISWKDIDFGDIESLIHNCYEAHGYTFWYEED